MTEEIWPHRSPKNLVSNDISNLLNSTRIPVVMLDRGLRIRRVTPMAALPMQALHEQEPALRPVIEHSLGEPDAYPILDSRDRLLRVAAELGISTQSIDSEVEMIAAYRRLTKPTTAFMALKRSVHGCAASYFRMIPNSPFLLKRRKSGRSGSDSPIMDC
jgi:hypothetical protein